MATTASAATTANATSGASFCRPATLDEALGQLAAHARAGVRPVLLAGGTDWMVERHFGAQGEPPALLDITGINDLRIIERTPGPGGVRFRLGAGVTYADLRRHPALSREVPILAAMARDVGAVQIQERGTLGGNLATGSPAADGVPVLVALSATVLLRSAAGARAVPVEDFYTGYRQSVMARDEMLVAVEFDAPTGPWMWRKVGTRLAQAISKVALAATARIEAGRVVAARLGMASVGPTVALLPSVRAELVGKEPAALDTERALAALRADIRPIDDVRSTGAYRLHVAGRLVAQFIDQLHRHRQPGQQ